MKYRKSILVFAIIPLCILLAGFFLFAVSIYLHDGRFLSIVKPISETQVIEHNAGGITGNIPQATGRVGTVIIHFDQPASAKGSVIFSVIDFSDNVIVYQNTYSMHDIFYKNSFPFGFPPFEQTNEHTYLFSIQPNKTAEFLKLESRKYPYEVLYQFDRSFLVKNPQTILGFLNKKIGQYGFYMFHSRSVIFYLAPVILYYIGLLLHIRDRRKLNSITSSKQIREFMHPTLLILIGFMIISSTLLPQIHTMFVVAVTALWVILSSHYQLGSRSSFVLALIFLLTCPLLFVSDMAQTASSITSWSFVLLLVGSVQGITGLTFKKVNISTITQIDHHIEKYYHLLLKSIY